MILNTNKLSYEQKINIYGLIPYFILYLIYKNKLVLLIFTHGALYHSSLNIYLRYIDIITNLTIGTYINCISTFQPTIILISYFSLWCWYLERYLNNINRSYFHVILVKLPLCYGLYLNEIK